MYLCFRECSIIWKNSFPANKVRREYFLRASVSCVTSFRKNLFFCMHCVTSLVKKSAVLKHTLLTITSPSFAVHLHRTSYSLLPVYFGRRYAVCCQSLLIGRALHEVEWHLPSFIVCLRWPRDLSQYPFIAVGCSSSLDVRYHWTLDAQLLQR